MTGWSRPGDLRYRRAYGIASGPALTPAAAARDEQRREPWIAVGPFCRPGDTLQTTGACGL